MYSTRKLLLVSGIALMSLADGQHVTDADSLKVETYDVGETAVAGGLPSGLPNRLEMLAEKQRNNGQKEIKKSPKKARKAMRKYKRRMRRKRMRIRRRKMRARIRRIERRNARTYLRANYVEIPKYVYDICNEAGNAFDICPELLMAMCWVESNCNPNEVSGAGAVGIMQVIPKYHEKRMAKLGCWDMYDARDCVMVGACYLADLLKTNSIDLALTAYNQGYHNGYATSYAQKVLSISEALERAHGK